MANHEHDRTPAEERAEIGAPAGEDAEEGRRRHGTQPLTENGDMTVSERRNKELHEDLQADHSAHPEEMGGRVKGRVTEEDLEEESGLGTAN